MENGREITLRLYKEGSYFPLIWAFTDINNDYYYTSVTPVELRKVLRRKFISFVQDHHAALFDLTRHILLTERELFTTIVHQFSGDSYHRVVTTLLLCAKRFGVKEKKNDLMMRLLLTHQDIADITSLTRETVSLAMIKLKKKKIISSYNRSLIIKDFDALMKESTLTEEIEAT